MKALLALVPLLMLGANSPHFTYASVPGSPIVQVQCLIGSGTAFRVGPQTLLSVNHVTSLQGCFIDGKLIHVAEHSGDFSILTDSEPSENWLTIDCGGFVKGHEYSSKGYARGLDKITTVDHLEATGDSFGQLQILSGTYTVIPGMSGGPVIDEDTGKVVGTTNTYDYPDGLSGSMPLKDTSVCKGRA